MPACASSARADSAASCSAWPARGSASAVRDCASVTTSSGSFRAAAACSAATRACCSAAAFASRASASGASACRAASARLPPISLGLLGAGLKPGPVLLGCRELRFEPGLLLGLVPLGIPAGLGHLLLRGPAHPVQLRPGRLGRLPLLSQLRLGLPGPDSASAARDSALAARDSAPRTASSRSCRAAATCSRAVRASCSAAAVASRASASAR